VFKGAWLWREKRGPFGFPKNLDSHQNYFYIVTSIRGTTLFFPESFLPGISTPSGMASKPAGNRENLNQLTLSVEALRVLTMKRGIILIWYRKNQILTKNR